MPRVAWLPFLWAISVAVWLVSQIASFVPPLLTHVAGIDVAGIVVLPAAVLWVVTLWAIEGTVDRKDLPEARLRALRRALPEVTLEEARALCVEVFDNDAWPGEWNGAITGYFQGRHDAAEMDRLLHERLFPDGWERGALL